MTSLPDLTALHTATTHTQSNYFNGYLNQRWNPNCKHCRDAVGHFCDVLTPIVAIAATSEANTTHQQNATGTMLRAGFGCFSQSGEQCLAIAAAVSAVTTTAQPPAGIIADDGSGLVCPHSCRQCEGWEGEATAQWLWGSVLVSSLCSPLLVWLFLPFLRVSPAAITPITNH